MALALSGNKFVCEFEATFIEAAAWEAIELIAG